MTACAITDHEVAYGLVGFYKKKGTRRHLFTNYVRFSKFEALELYEITPFSNTLNLLYQLKPVLELYEITPFSNTRQFHLRTTHVWISTNLHHSQTDTSIRHTGMEFWSYTKLHHSQTYFKVFTLSFGYLRIYIILKLRNLP